MPSYKRYKDNMNSTIKTRNLYSKLHKLHDDSIAFDLSIPINEVWNIEKSFFEDKIVLEAGCGGMGTQAILIKQMHVKELMVIDLSIENIAMVKSNIEKKVADLDNVDFFQLDLSKDLLPADKFDIIHCRGVFQHILDKEFALKNFNRSLKVSGMLLVGVYNKGTLLSWFSTLLRYPFKLISENTTMRILDLFIKSPDIVSGIVDHLYVPVQTRYSEKGLIRLFENYGFQLMKSVKPEFDIDSLNISFKHPFFKFWQKNIMFNSKNRIKWLSYILYGSGGHFMIFKKISHVVSN